MKFAVSRSLVIVLVVIGFVGSTCFTTMDASAAWDASGEHFPSSAYPGETVDFQFNLTNTGDRQMEVSRITLEIDWGGPTTEERMSGDTSLNAGDTSTFTCTFTTPEVEVGTYAGTITVTAKGKGDWFTSDNPYNVPFTILAVPEMDVTIEASSTAGPAPLEVTFTPTVTGGIGPYAYAWSSGDGAYGSDVTFTHRYAASGEYTATLAVTDERGTTVEGQLAVHVRSVPMTVTIQSSVIRGDVPLVTDLSASITGGTGPYEYSWTTGDGGRFNGPIFTHQYAKAGTYVVELTVTDPSGASGYDRTTITVTSSSSGLDIGSTIDGDQLLAVGYVSVFIAASAIVVGLMIRRNRNRPY
ncbi:MAG: PKD domain-containing protein [Methanomassiliicoccus sp.]|nr:PKD domain-containing protein [Methanomassiliicoccus sp.]